MSIGWRVLTGSTLVFPGVQSAMWLGRSLPMDRENAVLTASSFGFLMVAIIVSWISGAQKTLQIIASVFLPCILLTALLLILPK